MYLYNIVISRPNFPFDYLTYSYHEKLDIGKIVLITIKDSLVYGIVLSESKLIESQFKNLKTIDQVTDFILDSDHIDALQKISFLTFNSLSSLLTIALKPYELIISKKNSINHIKKNKSESKLNYFLTKDALKKIIELISNSKNTLIIFPEKGILTKIYNEVKEFLKIHKNNDFDLHNLLSVSDKKNLITFKSLLGDQTEKSNIFFGNKLTLLYNLNSIEKIIIVDEANPSYISESKIYFDAREIAFWLSKIYGIELNFISHLPSIRFLDSIQKELKELKYPKIKLKFLERSGRQNDFENIIHELNEEIESYHYNDDDIE